MACLEQFGIVPATTTSPALSPERCALNHEDFTEKALAVLDDVSDYAVTEVPAKLESYVSRWHPSGFMVYQLGESLGLGMLRLHVWPSSDRKAGEKGDTIHDHAWHVASLVLRGDYRDTLFDLESRGDVAEAERRPNGLLRLFDASYNPDTSQELTTDGTCVRVKPRLERTVRELETHTIEPDIFHQPTIRIGQAVATLVLNSYRVHEHGPYVLVDGPSLPIPEVRQPLSADDINATEQLLTG